MKLLRCGLLSAVSMTFETAGPSREEGRQLQKSHLVDGVNYKRSRWFQFSNHSNEYGLVVDAKVEEIHLQYMPRGVCCWFPWPPACC